MALNLQTGLGGGLNLGWPGTSGTSANASPQGPATAAQQGFGTKVIGQRSMSGTAMGVLSVGTISLGLLIWLWWSLPR